MDTLLRKLDKALARKGSHIVRKGKHFLIVRNRDQHIVCDMDMTGMTKKMLRSNIEILLLQ